MKERAGLRRRALGGLAALLLTLAGCGGSGGQTEAAAAPSVSPDADPPTSADMSWVSADEPWGLAPEASETPEAAAAPVPAESPTPTPAPAEEALRPGEYVGSDGSVLTVYADGTCTYEADLSGTVNGTPMSGRLTFHGVVEGGAFTFTKVTYFGLDLTEAAKSSGYDASYWEQAAAILYGGG